jgi:hypothetical protein
MPDSTSLQRPEMTWQLSKVSTVRPGFHGRTSRILACAGFAVLLLAACHKSRESTTPVVTIEHEISPQPARVGAVTINLKLFDRSLKPVTGARIALEGNMSHAGMGPTFSDARETAPGQYRSRLELTMGGDWIVLVHLALPDGKKQESQFEIKGVRSD